MLCITVGVMSGRMQCEVSRMTTDPNKHASVYCSPSTRHQTCKNQNRKRPPSEAGGTDHFFFVFWLKPIQPWPVGLNYSAAFGTQSSMNGRALAWERFHLWSRTDLCERKWLTAGPPVTDPSFFFSSFFFFFMYKYCCSLHHFKAPFATGKTDLSFETL